MDVAKHIAQWKDQSPEQWVCAANRYLPPGRHAPSRRCDRLSALGDYLAGRSPVPVPAAAPFHHRCVDGSARKRRRHRISARSRPRICSVGPRSRRSAVVAGGGGCARHDAEPDIDGHLCRRRRSNGQAIIASNRGQEKKYQIGQAVDNANGTTLHAVLRDRVILNRGDRWKLCGCRRTWRYAARRNGLPSPMPAPAARRPATGRCANDQPERDAVHGHHAGRTAYTRKDRSVGFRINPGRDRESFETLGLLPGDVVTDINGTVLDDPSRGLASLRGAWRSDHGERNRAAKRRTPSSSSSTPVSCRISRGEPRVISTQRRSRAAKRGAASSQRRSAARPQCSRSSSRSARASPVRAQDAPGRRSRRTIAKPTFAKSIEAGRRSHGPADFSSTLVSAAR